MVLGINSLFLFEYVLCFPLITWRHAVAKSTVRLFQKTKFFTFILFFRKSRLVKCIYIVWKSKNNSNHLPCLKLVNLRSHFFCVFAIFSNHSFILCVKKRKCYKIINWKGNFTDIFVSSNGIQVEKITRIWLVLSHAIISVIMLSSIKKYNLLTRKFSLPNNQ